LILFLIKIPDFIQDKNQVKIHQNLTILKTNVNKGHQPVFGKNPNKTKNKKDATIKIIGEENNSAAPKIAKQISIIATWIFLF
jgi:hypothetical protein